MKYTHKFKRRVLELVHNPDFQKPLSEIEIDYSKQGTLTLVTKMSKLCQQKKS